MRGTTLLATAAVAAAVLFPWRTASTDEEAGGSDAAVQAADHLGAERHALVVGIDDYRDGGIPDLDARESGARGVLAVLQDLETGGVPEANVQLLLGAKATRASVRAALNRLRRLPREATVFVYFAGHVATKGEDAYWVTQDSKEDDLPGTAVAAAEVSRLLDAVPAERVLLVMDCRHAAGLVGDKAARGDRPSVLARYHGPGYAALGAAAAQEHTIDAKGGDRSIFTHVLIEGLSGKADADENGIVALGELAAYVERRVRVLARKRRGLERPVVDLEGGLEPSQFLLTVEPKELGRRLRDDEPAETRRLERLAALKAFDEDRVTTEQARIGRFLLRVLPEGLAPYELEQRTRFVDLVEGRLDPTHLTDALAAIRRADRRTLAVPDEFESIQAAIDAAQAGDTVLVRAGEYDERIVLKSGLRLVGEGRERTVIRMVPGEPEILLVENCAWGSIESLQFDGAGGTKIGEWSPDGIHLKGSSVRVREVLAHSCLGCGMYASGTGCRPHVLDCTFERNVQDGMCFGDVDGGEIAESICRSNGAVGLAVRKARGAITVRACLCVLNKHAGIGVCGGATATLVGNDCQRNAGHGILAWDDKTSLTLEENTCSRNEVHGILLIQGAVAVANDNVCSRNRECGIVVSGAGTQASVVGNRCLDNDLSESGDLGGIVFRDGARGEATSNTCDDNTCGILVTGAGTSVRLQDNRCRKNETSGIDFTDSAPGHAVGNQCDENEHGITVSKTEVTVEGNTIRRNTMHGIFIDRGGSGTASGNRCEENEQDGIHVTDAGTRAEILKNTCTSNGGHGIQFARGAGGVADDNDCSENKAFGIVAFNSGTRPTFRKNRCTDNGRAGIGKQRGAAPVVERNNVQSGNGT